MSANTLKNILENANIELFLDEGLSNYTSFKIGGNADYIIKPKNVEELIYTIKSVANLKIPYYFLGNGSNILVSDDGYRGAVILTSGLNEMSVSGDILTCQAGATVARLCGFALESNLSGLEFAFGIPGSVGGGIYMNAGAYGGEIKDILISCCYLDKDGNKFEITGDQLELSYRHSFFTDKNYFIYSGKFKLLPDNASEIKLKMDDYLNRRKTKQPLEYPSCGSTFKRPENGYASALIDECGLKGYKIGGAQVSEKHAGFIINCGNATCKDVLSLIEHVQNVVLEKKGILLECEVKTL